MYTYIIAQCLQLAATVAANDDDRCMTFNRPSKENRYRLIPRPRKEVAARVNLIAAYGVELQRRTLVKLKGRFPDKE